MAQSEEQRLRNIANQKQKNISMQRIKQNEITVANNKIETTKQRLDKIRKELSNAEKEKQLANNKVLESNLFGKARRNSPEFKDFLKKESKVKKLKREFDEAKRNFAVARENEDILKRGFSRVGFGKKKDTTQPQKELVQQSISISFSDFKTTQSDPIIIKDKNNNLKSSRISVEEFERQKLLDSGFQVQSSTPGTQTPLLETNLNIREKPSFEEPARSPQVFVNSSIPENLRNQLELQTQANQFSLNPIQSGRAALERGFDFSVTQLQQSQANLENFNRFLIRETKGTNLEVFGRTGAIAAGFVSGTQAATEGALNFARNPITSTKDSFNNLNKIALALRQTGQQLSRGDPFTTGKIAGEVTAPLTAQKVFSFGSRVGGATVARLDPRFIKPNEGVLTVPSKLDSRNAFEINLAGGVDTTAKPLSFQAALAGTTQDLVSAQRGLFNLFENEKLIDKPKPKPDSDVLETSFFFDPQSNLRQSRLFTKTEAASLRDITKGNFQLFETQKPQAIFIEQQKIQDLPKDIKTDLLLGKTLSNSQKKRLEKLQQTPTGEAKPIGFLSRELEVTLPKGETLIREATPAVTNLPDPNALFLKGTRTPIIRTSIKQTPENLKNALDDFKAGKISNTELDKIRKKETGLSSSDLTANKVLFSSSRLNKIGVGSFLSKSSSKSSVSNLNSNSALSGTSIQRSLDSSSFSFSQFSPFSSGSIFGSGSSGSGSSGTSSLSSLGNSGGSGTSLSPLSSLPPSTPTRKGLSFRNEERKAKQPKVNVFVREFGKEIKLNKKPVTLEKGKALGADVVDNTTRASFELRSATKKRLQETTAPKKFFGRKTKTGLFFKEYNEFRIDTPGEKKELSVAKYLKDRGFKL